MGHKGMGHKGYTSSLKIDIKLFAVYTDHENRFSYAHVAMYTGDKLIDILAVKLEV